MTAPTRALAAFRPTASPGVLATAAAISATFVATPFVISEAVVAYSTSAGIAALLSTAQVGGFTAANLYAGRHLQASPAMARRALAVFLLCNLTSAVQLTFALLMVLRTVAGLAMGLLTWVAWADSATDPKRRGEVAAIGPLSAAVVAPFAAVASSNLGLSGIYLMLAAVTAAGFLLPLRIEPSDLASRRPIETQGVRPLLLALGVFTAGGSAVFVFGGVLAADHVGMSTLVFSLVLSANAVASIPVARYPGRRRLPAVWMSAIAVCAGLMATTSSPAVFALVIVLWGAAFWVVVPEMFSVLSDRSVHPADRVGDAQAVMAIGRALGPTVGGILVGTGSFTLLGLVSAGLILTAAGAVHATLLRGVGPPS